MVMLESHRQYDFVRRTGKGPARRGVPPWPSPAATWVHTYPQMLHASGALLGVSWPDCFGGKAALAPVGKQVADETRGHLFSKF